MKLLLIDDDGNILKTWSLSRKGPITDQNSNPFTAIHHEVGPEIQKKIEFEIAEHWKRVDAQTLEVEKCEE